MITIVLPISRTEYLDQVFYSLDKLLRPDDTELLIITDGDKALQKAVDKHLDSINYAHIRVINFGDAPAEDINSRRYRISAIHNKLRHYIPTNCKLVFSIEDDTTFGGLALQRLINAYNETPNCAYAEGIQLGRRNSPYVGAWLADDVYEPKLISSLYPRKFGLQEIDAGGLYCALIDADLYKMHQFQPFDKDGTNGLSCDVNFGFYLRQMGYKCVVDHGLEVDHLGESGTINPSNTKAELLEFYLENNEWKVRRV